MQINKFMVLCFMLLGIGPMAFAQNISVQKVCDLPAELGESSGLVKIGSNRFVTHNDSGSEPILYVFDSSGTILRRIRLSNASNIDWEDLTIDSKGNLYVGDFGNNGNNRQNLKVYLIASPNTFSKDSTVASIISFSYADQKSYPPAANRMNYDMEAFYWLNDTLFLHSKDRSDPYTGYTKIYKLPAKLGTYSLSPKDSFYTGPGGYLNYSVTGAATHAASKQSILLGYDKCWLFGLDAGNHLIKGSCRTFAFPGLSQKEAICFENAGRVWYTQENSVLGTVGLFSFNIPPYSPSGEMERIKKAYKIYPVPAENILYVELLDEIAEPGMVLEIIDLKGKPLLSSELEMSGVNQIDIAGLKAGRYFIRINGMAAGDLIKKQ